MDIQQIKEAQNYPKISELNKNELFLFSMDIVKKAFLRVNQETTDELIEVTTKDVATFLEAECKALTIKECDIAIIYGLSGEFGVFYRMSVQTIIQFLKAFKSHVNRSQAIIEKYGNVKQLEVHSKDFSIEQLSDFERNASNEFKQTKRLPIGLPCLPVYFVCFRFLLVFPTFSSTPKVFNSAFNCFYYVQFWRVEFFLFFHPFCIT